MFTYGKDIPLDDVTSTEPLVLNEASAVASLKFPFDYARDIFITDENE